MSVSHSTERRPAQLLAIAVAGFLLVVSAAGAILLASGRREVVDPQDSQRPALAQNAAESVDRMLNHSLAEERTFIDRQKRELLSGDVKTVTQLLRGFTEDSLLLSSEAFLIRGGKVFATWPEKPAVIGKDLTAEFEHLRNVQEMGESSVSGVIASPIFFDQPVVEIASPVQGEGQRVEAILTSGFLVDGSALQEFFERLDAGPQGFFFIVDSENEPIVYPESANRESAMTAGDKVQSRASISSADWILTVRQDRSDLQEPSTIETWKPIVLTAILIVAVGLLGYLAFQFLQRAESNAIELEENERRLAETQRRADETERRVAAIEQVRSSDLQRLEHLDAEKDEFVSMVSHELRGPLTIMKGWIEMILEGRFGELTEEQNEYLTISQNNIDRMFALVEDLLTVSKAESGRLDMMPEEVSVSEVISDLAVSVEQIVEERGIQLHLQLEPNLPPVEADRHRIEQVITNFLSNAIKFTPEGGTVSMKARSEDGGIVAEVTDTGIGIPTGEQGELFTKFFRTSNVKKNKVPGSGLGLAISKAIVEQHGGRVGLKSVEGEGSTFWMWLPLALRGEASIDA